MDLVSLGDGQVEAHQGQRVGLGDAQGRVQAPDEVGHLVEADELGGVGIVPGRGSNMFRVGGSIGMWTSSANNFALIRPVKVDCFTVRPGCTLLGVPSFARF